MTVTGNDKREWQYAGGVEKTEPKENANFFYHEIPLFWGGIFEIFLPIVQYHVGSLYPVIVVFNFKWQYNFNGYRNNVLRIPTWLTFVEIAEHKCCTRIWLMSKQVPVFSMCTF